MSVPAIRFPGTDEEWQEAVDVAYALLHLDSARAYGMLVGGPEVDVERCRLILRAGAQRSTAASPLAIQNLVRELAEMGGLAPGPGARP